MGDSDEGRGSRRLRGILDACLLSLIAERDRYDYELATALHEAGLPIMKDGPTYPLLSRLERRRLLESYRVPAAGGPPRRYYRITTDGWRELDATRDVWTAVASAIDAVLGRRNHDAEAAAMARRVRGRLRGRRGGRSD